ncbi:MAG: NADH-quinone oxidoreductase subunit C [Deltaproteobacteria bacterium]|nr:NADH-quinone oxidoreductase subunit C [Deltaproteobacteria bacterium]
MDHPLIRFDASAKAKVLARLQEQRGSELLHTYEEGLALGIDVHGQNILSVLSFLKDDPELGFTGFLDVTAVDYSKYVLPQVERFAVIYILMSPHSGARVKVRAFVAGDPPTIDSATSLYQGAGWGEREAFDFFGIKFVGHPNLKRILMPDDYRDFPLRKEYPLRGRGERADFEVYRAFKD